MNTEEQQELWERGRKSQQVDMLIDLVEKLGKDDPAVESIIGGAVMRLFFYQSLTISKSESEVRIQCDNADDANELFEWLSRLGSKYVSAK